jgi:RNA polymerase subunit RPABC4/transcription elongation factor Spt4
MTKTKPMCPKCNSRNLAKFLYGLVRRDTKSDNPIEDEKIILGGCSREWDSPDWRCNDCAHRWNDDDKMKTFMSEIGKICPECDSQSIAWIFWGYPGDMDWYLKAIDDKEITGGGCLVTDHDPKWECNDCFHRWGVRDDD